MKDGITDHPLRDVSLLAMASLTKVNTVVRRILY